MVKFETTVNSETTKSINNMQMKKITWLYIVFSLFFLLVGGVELLSYLNGEEEASLAFAIFFMAFGVLFFPICKLITVIFQKKLDKSMSLLNGNTRETYEFYEDKMIITTQNGDIYSSRVEASYNYVFKVVENNDAFYFYISKAQCHVVMKKFLVEGSRDELVAYLTKHFRCVASMASLTYKRNS